MGEATTRSYKIHWFGESVGNASIGIGVDEKDPMEGPCLIFVANTRTQLFRVEIGLNVLLSKLNELGLTKITFPKEET